MRRQEVKRFEESHRFQTIRKKRKSKYDVPNYYEGSTKPPFFVSHPGQSKFYDQKEKNGTLTDGKVSVIHFIVILFYKVFKTF